jgi:homocitrate synthase
LTHVRCHMDDVKVAVETGVDGVYAAKLSITVVEGGQWLIDIHRDIMIGTSKALQKHSHGKDIDAILKSAREVIEYVKSKGLEVRFSSEDSFRSDLVDLLTIYKAVDKIGVDRIGVADTIGCATPRQVYDLVRTLRGVVCKPKFSKQWCHKPSPHTDPREHCICKKI